MTPKERKQGPLTSDFDVTSTSRWTSRMDMITSFCSKYMTSGYQPARVDNLCAGNTLSDRQNVGYSEKYRTEYVKISGIKR